MRLWPEHLRKIPMIRYNETSITLEGQRTLRRAPPGTDLSGLSVEAQSTRGAGIKPGVPLLEIGRIDSHARPRIRTSRDTATS